MLVLGADTFQIGLLKWLNEMGFETHVITNRPNDPGVAFAHTCHALSYTDVEAVWQIYEAIHAVQIFSVASDASILCQSIVQQKAAVAGYLPEFIQFFTDKSLYKTKLKQTLPKNVPNLKVCETKQELIQFYKANQEDGIIVKPCRGSGSKNVTYLNSLKEVQVFNWEDNAKDFLVEEFIKGIEIGGDFFCYNRQVVFYYPTVKKVNNYNVPTSHLVLKNNNERLKLISFFQEIITGLSLPNGVYNVDVMLKNGCPYLLDLSPRIGGNCIPDIIALSTGVNEWNFMHSLLFNKAPNSTALNWKKPHGVYIINSNKTGIIKTIITDKHPYSDAIVSVFWKSKIGSKVEIFNQGSKHLGYIIYQADTDMELLNISKEIELFNWFTLDLEMM